MHFNMKLVIGLHRKACHYCMYSRRLIARKHSTLHAHWTAMCTFSAHFHTPADQPTEMRCNGQGVLLQYTR